MNAQTLVKNPGAGQNEAGDHADHEVDRDGFERGERDQGVPEVVGFLSPDLVGGHRGQGQRNSLLLDLLRVGRGEHRTQLRGHRADLLDELLGREQGRHRFAELLFDLSLVGFTRGLVAVKLVEGLLGWSLHRVEDVHPDAIAEHRDRNEADDQADDQADQGHDQAIAQVFDVVTEAHRDHRLLFGEEVFIGRHESHPLPFARRIGEGSRWRFAPRSSAAGRRKVGQRGAIRPFPRPMPTGHRRRKASRGRPDPVVRSSSPFILSCPPQERPEVFAVAEFRLPRHNQR